MSKLFFIGAGKMASALAGGVVRAGVLPAAEIGAFDVDPRAAHAFSGATGVSCVTGDEAAALADAEAVLLAVKPQMLTAAVEGIRSCFAGKLVISIVAGVSISRLEALTGASRIIRVMPNTPALVGEGAAAYAAAPGATSADEELVGKILGAVGMVTKFSEGLLDAVTGLSGSGPAYVFEFIRALADGGVAEGLSRDAALRLAAQTVLGSARMVLESGEHPSVLKDRVTSPAGTTIRGLEVLADRGFAGAVTQAVRAGASRSRELGGAK